MTKGNDIEDVESKQNYVEAFGGCSIGDADTAEGQARRAEEAFLEEEIGELQEEVEDLEELPALEEAEMGELYRVPKGGQFSELKLVDNDTADLIGVLTEGEDSDKAGKGTTDEEVRTLVEALEEGGTF